jgi:hypothetical protein
VTNSLRVLVFVLPLLLAWFTWRTCRDLAQKGAREDDYPRPYPKDRTPYEVTPGATAGSSDAERAERAARRSRAVRALSAMGTAAGAAIGYVLGRRRPKKIVIEETRKR